MSGILDLGGLLSTIYSGSSGAGGATSSDPIGDLKRAEAGSTKAIAAEAAQPQVARDIAAFRTAVASATSPAQLLQNPTVLKVLLTANGLGDQVQYPALAQKALLSNTADTNSVADSLSNASWKATAATYGFATKGLSVIQTQSVIDTTANGYAEVLWRQSLDQTTPGLSEALTFRSAASGIKSVDQILGDSTLRTVVLGALGIPPQIAYQDLGAEEQAISSRLDITKFQDPAFVESFTQRYLILNNASGASSTAAPSALASYGFSDASSSSDNSNLLASLVVQSTGLLA